jgi:hypothetical protein
VIKISEFVSTAAEIITLNGQRRATSLIFTTAAA